MLHNLVCSLAKMAHDPGTFFPPEWRLLQTSIFPSEGTSCFSPRGVPVCAARAVGRGLLQAEAVGAVLGGGQRAGRRAEPPEPSYSRERRETMEGKGGWSAALGFSSFTSIVYIPMRMIFLNES